jgi:hypothetical protein
MTNVPGPDAGDERIGVLVETTEKRTFASAVDWPGWCRSGRDEVAAVEALARSAARYAIVAAEAGLMLPADAAERLVVVDRRPGTASTAFGVPAAIAELDARPVSADEAHRIAALVAAAWAVFGRVAASAPVVLRKGPRGGGRDRDPIVRHVIESDGYYAHEIGLRGSKPLVADPAVFEPVRAAILDLLRQPSDGSPLAGRRWPVRYAARRIAWHPIDHAWEIEDRSEPTA